MFDKIEKEYDIKLKPGIVVVRVDGKGFSKLLKPYRPYDRDHAEAMIISAMETSKIMGNFILAYTQSDEISFVMACLGQAEPWFDNRVQKITSVLASSVSSHYSVLMTYAKEQPIITQFDARAFVVDDVQNLIKYLRLRISNSVNNSTSSMYRHVVGNKNISLNSMSAELIKLDVDINESFRHGTIIIRHHREFTRINPMDIRSELSNFIIQLFEMKMLKKEFK